MEVLLGVAVVIAAWGVGMVIRDMIDAATVAVLFIGRVARRLTAVVPSLGGPR